MEASVGQQVVGQEGRMEEGKLLVLVSSIVMIETTWQFKCR